MKGRTQGHDATVQLSVIGTDYLGATHAACLAAIGHEVVGVDCDPDRFCALGRAAT